MLLEQKYSSDVRKCLGETLDKVYETNVPVLINKKIAGGSRDFVFISKRNFDDLINIINLDVQITNPEKNLFIAECSTLDLFSYAESYEGALDEFVNDLMVYAEDYQNNMNLYLNSPNRKSHLPYMIKVWNSFDENELKESIVLVDCTKS